MSEVKHPMPKGLEEKIHQYAQKYVINKDGFGCTVDYKECCRAIWETEEVQGMIEALKKYADPNSVESHIAAKEALEFMEKK